LRLWQYFSTIVGIIFRHPIVGVVVIPIDSAGQIVLVQRRDNRKWSLPGGFVDWGEDIKQTAVRELLEETGLTITEFGRLVGVYSSPNRDPRVHSICVTLMAKVEGIFQIIDPGEVLEVQAFNRVDLPWDQMSHDHQELLEDFFAGKTAIA
jgi:8-oxo-dGTP diphosphatase